MRGDRRSPRFASVAVALAATAALLALLSGCGSSAARPTSATNASAPASYRAEATLSPATTAPPLRLRNYLGQPVDIAAYRGKAVLVTFLYTHCPDICPLIASQLHNALNAMGAATASKAEIIAVSVDPKGDTRQAVAGFLAAHQMTGRMQYLVGSTRELARVWRAWGVGSERDAKNPDLVEHSGVIYGITASGKRATLYSARFKPADVAHDVPLLAAR